MNIRGNSVITVYFLILHTYSDVLHPFSSNLFRLPCWLRSLLMSDLIIWSRLASLSCSLQGKVLLLGKVFCKSAVFVKVKVFDIVLCISTRFGPILVFRTGFANSAFSLVGSSSNSRVVFNFCTGLNIELILFFWVESIGSLKYHLKCALVPFKSKLG